MHIMISIKFKTLQRIENPLWNINALALHTYHAQSNEMACHLQYQMKNITAAHEFMKTNNADIELPPTSMESNPVKLMFVNDPDGIINEFFGIGR